MIVVTASAKAKTAPFTAIALTRGSCAGLSASNSCTPILATPMPRHPPSAASKRLSVRSWRSNRVRGAPSAARMANSLRRCAPRASSRLVTFTQAMSNTKMTAPINASNAGLTPLVTSAWSEFTINLSPTLRRAASEIPPTACAQCYRAHVWLAECLLPGADAQPSEMMAPLLASGGSEPHRTAREPRSRRQGPAHSRSRWASHR